MEIETEMESCGTVGNHTTPSESRELKKLPMEKNTQICVFFFIYIKRGQFKDITLYNWSQTNINTLEETNNERLPHEYSIIQKYKIILFEY